MKAPQAKLEERYYPLKGGEDLLTPMVEVDPGRARETQNYELDAFGRYRLIDGYEVFDGQPEPSSASYWILNFDAGSTEIEVEDVVTGAGGASGEVLAIEVESGTWALGTAAGYLVLFNVTGTYVNNEILSVSGAVALANGTTAERNAATDENDSLWLLAAIEATRADIAAVPGSGDLLGVHTYNGTIYAFRNNAGDTATAMYKSSTSGWTLCDLGESLAFNTGTAAFVEGETVTEGAVSAVVRRVVVTSGTWAGGDASGYFTISGRAGGSFSAGAITGSVSGSAAATGVQTTNTLTKDGRFEFVNENFGGHAGTYRMYGVDGVNKGFEWDGTYFVFITTGMTTDAPSHIAAFRKHLFYSFSGGSAQHSAPGEPYVWSAVTGAAELGMSEEITGFLVEANAMAIFCRNSTKILYGHDTGTWDLPDFSNESGAIEWTIQEIGTGIYLDDRGLTTLAAVQTYGDFKANTLSKFIDPWLKTKLGNVQSSMRVKEKNQYRLFFDDMTALTLTLDGNKVVGFTRQLYDVLPVCTCSGEDANGREELFFGSDDGYVYQMDKGTSFNGEPLAAFIRFHFNHLKSPRTKKRIRRVILELDTPIKSYIQVTIDFDYGKTGNQGIMFNPENPASFWGEGYWGTFIWDGSGSISSIPVDVDGTGLNFAFTIYYSGIFEMQPATGGRSGLTGAEPHTLQGYIVHYSPRGVQK